MNGSVTKFAVTLVLLTTLAGCATQPERYSDDVQGFFFGFLHGYISLFTLIGSLFMDIRIYAFPNSGFLYDLGFFLGFIALAGSSSASR
jgi:hypothetical protein